MKKLIIIFIGILCLFNVGCGRGSIKEISFEEYQKLMENEETFILFIGSHTCSHCIQYNITLEEVIKKYNVDFNYIDIAKLNEEQSKEFSDSIRFDGTPTTVFIENGKDDSCNLFSCDDTKRIEGSADFEEVVEMLKNKGYIKG